MKTLLTLAVSTISSIALAAPITFDLRDPAIETIDEVNSFSLTQSGLTATLSAVPATFNEPPLRALVLNQTSSSFGVNVVNTTCGGTEDSALVDGGCLGEGVSIFFDHDVILGGFRVSNFGSSDEGVITIGATTIDVLSTGTHPLGNIFLAAGDPWSIAWVAGNGFSFDNFTVTVPEPGTFSLIGLALVGLALARRRKLN